MSEKIIICAINREGIQKVLELINPDIEVIGYAVETEDNREIYRWLDNIHLNCDILREKFIGNINIFQYIFKYSYYSTNRFL